MTQAYKESALLTKKTDTKPVEVKVRCPSAGDVSITYDAGADISTMTTTAITVLKEICVQACVSSVRITSIARTAKDQARVMYELIKAKDVSYAKSLYGSGGDMVIDTYVEALKKKRTAEEIKNEMERKINEVGPSKVSNHIVSGDGRLCVFDVAPSSISNSEARRRFSMEAKAHPSVARFLEPPADPAFHLEVMN